MQFHVWPAYFREAAERDMRYRFESAVFWGLAILFSICSLIFEQNAFRILFLLTFFSVIFALITLQKYLYVKKYMLIDVSIDAEGVRLLDYKNRTIKFIKYDRVNSIERQVVDIDANPRYNHLYEHSRHELIFIYIDGARCFQDLHLETSTSTHSRLFVDHWEVNKYAPRSFLYDTSNGSKYWGPDIFFDDNCIAFAFDGNAWNLLHSYTKRRQDLFL